MLLALHSRHTRAFLAVKLTLRARPSVAAVLTLAGGAPPSWSEDEDEESELGGMAAKDGVALSHLDPGRLRAG